MINNTKGKRQVGVLGLEYTVVRGLWPTGEIAEERVWQHGSRSMWMTSIHRTNGHIDVMRGIESNPYNATRAISGAQDTLFSPDTLRG